MRLPIPARRPRSKHNAYNDPHVNSGSVSEKRHIVATADTNSYYYIYIPQAQGDLVICATTSTELRLVDNGADTSVRRTTRGLINVRRRTNTDPLNVITVGSAHPINWIGTDRMTIHCSRDPTQTITINIEVVVCESFDMDVSCEYDVDAVSAIHRDDTGSSGLERYHLRSDGTRIYLQRNGKRFYHIVSRQQPPLRPHVNAVTAPIDNTKPQPPRASAKFISSVMPRITSTRIALQELSTPTLQRSYNRHEQSELKLFLAERGTLVATKDDPFFNTHIILGHPWQGDTASTMKYYGVHQTGVVRAFCESCVKAKLHRSHPINMLPRPSHHLEQAGCYWQFDGLAFSTTSKLGGYNHTLAFVDVASGLVLQYPCVGMGSQDIISALLQFKANLLTLFRLSHRTFRDGVTLLRADSLPAHLAPETRAAMTNLGFVFEVAGVGVKNDCSRIERVLQWLKERVLATIHHSPLGIEFWPEAAHFVVDTASILCTGGRDPAITSFNVRPSLSGRHAFAAAGHALVYKANRTSVDAHHSRPGRLVGLDALAGQYIVLISEPYDHLIKTAHFRLSPFTDADAAAAIGKPSALFPAPINPDLGSGDNYDLFTPITPYHHRLPSPINSDSEDDNREFDQQSSTQQLSQSIISTDQTKHQDTDKWQCHLCTYLNTALHLQCAACSEIRRAGPPLANTLPSHSPADIDTMKAEAEVLVEGRANGTGNNCLIFSLASATGNAYNKQSAKSVRIRLATTDPTASGNKVLYVQKHALPVLSLITGRDAADIDRTFTVVCSTIYSGDTEIEVAGHGPKHLHLRCQNPTAATPHFVPMVHRPATPPPKKPKVVKQAATRVKKSVKAKAPKSASSSRPPDESTTKLSRATGNGHESTPGSRDKSSSATRKRQHDHQITADISAQQPPSHRHRHSVQHVHAPQSLPYITAGTTTITTTLAPTSLRAEQQTRATTASTLRGRSTRPPQKYGYVTATTGSTTTTVHMDGVTPAPPPPDLMDLPDSKLPSPVESILFNTRDGKYVYSGYTSLNEEPINTEIFHSLQAAMKDFATRPPTNVGKSPLTARLEEVQNFTTGDNRFLEELSPQVASGIKPSDIHTLLELYYLKFEGGIAVKDKCRICFQGSRFRGEQLPDDFYLSSTPWVSTVKLHVGLSNIGRGTADDPIVKRTADIRCAYSFAEARGPPIYIAFRGTGPEALHPSGQRRVYQMRRAIYGFHRSGAWWENYFATYITADASGPRMTRGVKDASVYLGTRHLNLTGLRFVISTDDLLVVGRRSQVNRLASVLRVRFGDVGWRDLHQNWYCGARYFQSCPFHQKCYARISMNDYIDKSYESLSKFGYGGPTAGTAHQTAVMIKKTTPSLVGRTITNIDRQNKPTVFQLERHRAVGGQLGWISSHRDDIRYAVAIAGSLTLNSSDEIYRSILLFCMRYLHSSKNRSSCFHDPGDAKRDRIIGWCDSSFHSYPSTVGDRLASHQGYLLTLNGAILTARSNKCSKAETQGPHSSTAEAEMSVFLNCCVSALYHRDLMTEWGYDYSAPIAIMTDSSAVFHNILNSKVTGVTKYWQSDFWRCHGMYRAGLIQPCLITTACQLSDFLTKPVSAEIFRRNTNDLYCDVTDADNAPARKMGDVIPTISPGHTY